jgi:hypothetical protein
MGQELVKLASAPDATCTLKPSPLVERVPSLPSPRRSKAQAHKKGALRPLGNGDNKGPSHKARMSSSSELLKVGK